MFLGKSFFLQIGIVKTLLSSVNNAILDANVLHFLQFRLAVVTIKVSLLVETRERIWGHPQSALLNKSNICCPLPSNTHFNKKMTLPKYTIDKYTPGTNIKEPITGG